MRPASAGTRSYDRAVYAVPQSIVFRECASEDAQLRRKLLLVNGGAEPVSFRLTLPSSGLFRVEGECVACATFDAISSVEIAPGKAVTLTVHLLRDDAAELPSESLSLIHI